MVPSQSGPVGEQDLPAVIQPNNFKFKSLSNWAFNPVFGCLHGCSFCYVPSAATIKAEHRYEEQGFIPKAWQEERDSGKHWADFHWGQYALLKKWDEPKFMASLRAAEKAKDLAPDGHRAVIFCSTTDPYQTFQISGDAARAKQLTTGLGSMVERSLELILKQSSLNVRILTRSPLVKKHFALYREFGNRLIFGMSLPTLNDTLSKVYEPGAPGPKAKLKTLEAAKEAGLNIYVALAPTLPDESEKDLKELLRTVAELKPLTIYHEPINLRAENALRIAAQAKKEGMTIRAEVFQNPSTWREYAFDRLTQIERLARELRLPEGVLHSWPDADLASKSGFMKMKLMQFQREHPALQALPPAQQKNGEEEWRTQVQPWITYWHAPEARIASWPGVREPRWNK